jgi:polar amino acid transport system substrate-binding protein
MRLRRLSIIALPLTLLAAACAPADEDTSGSATDDNPAATAAECAEDKTMMEGMLQIGTDSPAFPPWFEDNDPTNGEGFESAVAYEVADRLGFDEDSIEWVKVKFNNSYKPGPKDFDFNINQVSITPERAAVVDFSDGYYQAAQAVVVLQNSPAGGVTTVAELKDLKLGAQTGTTSLTAVREIIKPTTEPAVFEDTTAATQALLNGQIDAVLADLPTAFFITAVQLPKGRIVGQFQAETGEIEEYGMLFEKGNPLRDCVNLALADMKEDGSLAAIETEWLSEVAGVPELS